MRETVTLPDLGGSAQQAVVIDLAAQPGDAIAEGEALLIVEADKIDMEIPAPRGGIVAEYLVAVDDEVNVGSPVCVLEVEG